MEIILPNYNLPLDDLEHINDLNILKGHYFKLVLLPKENPFPLNMNIIYNLNILKAHYAKFWLIFCQINDRISFGFYTVNLRYPNIRRGFNNLRVLFINIL